MTPLPALAPALAGAVACLLAAVCLRPVRRAVPYLTGMTLAAATAGALMTAYGAPDRWVSAILLAAAAVALLGLIANVGALPLVTRLIVESLAAGGVVLCGVQVTLTGDWLDGPVSVMWIVAMTNAYGLLDRLGGALAAVAAVTGAFLAVTALVLGDPALAVLPAALAGACLGALPYGRARGRVRLGPSGSLFAGFVLTCTAAGLTAGRGTAVIAAGLLLPALAAIVGAGAYAARRPRRASRPTGPARKAAPALCGVSAGTGT
ncbi:MraY family glycosyltransferase, partial [Microbispora hainanensis]